MNSVAHDMKVSTHSHKDYLCVASVNITFPIMQSPQTDKHEQYNRVLYVLNSDVNLTGWLLSVLIYKCI